MLRKKWNGICHYHTIRPHPSVWVMEYHRHSLSISDWPKGIIVSITVKHTVWLQLIMIALTINEFAGWQPFSTTFIIFFVIGFALGVYFVSQFVVFIFVVRAPTSTLSEWSASEREREREFTSPKWKVEISDNRILLFVHFGAELLAQPS